MGFSKKESYFSLIEI